MVIVHSKLLVYQRVIKKNGKQWRLLWGIYRNMGSELDMIVQNLKISKKNEAPTEIG
jgi:hypothetical protein